METSNDNPHITGVSTVLARSGFQVALIPQGQRFTAAVVALFWQEGGIRSIHQIARVTELPLREVRKAARSLRHAAHCTR